MLIKLFSLIIIILIILIIYQENNYSTKQNKTKNVEETIIDVSKVSESSFTDVNKKNISELSSTEKSVDKISKKVDESLDKLKLINNKIENKKTIVSDQKKIIKESEKKVIDIERNIKEEEVKIKLIKKEKEVTKNKNDIKDSSKKISKSEEKVKKLNLMKEKIESKIINSKEKIKEAKTKTIEAKKEKNIIKKQIKKSKEKVKVINKKLSDSKEKKNKLLNLSSDLKIICSTFGKNNDDCVNINLPKIGFCSKNTKKNISSNKYLNELINKNDKSLSCDNFIKIIENKNFVKERRKNQRKKNIRERLLKAKILVCEGLLIDGSEKNIKLFKSKGCHEMKPTKQKYEEWLSKKEEGKLKKKKEEEEKERLRKKALEIKKKKEEEQIKLAAMILAEKKAQAEAAKRKAKELSIKKANVEKEKRRKEKEATKLAAQKLAAQKLAAQKLAAQKIAAQKLAAQKLAAEKLAKKEEEMKARLATEKLEKKLAEKKAQAEAAVRLAKDLAIEKANVELERRKKEKETKKLAAQKLAAQKLAAQKLAAQKLAAKKLAEKEAAKLATEKLEKKLAEKKAAELLKIKLAKKKAAEKLAYDKAHKLKVKELINKKLIKKIKDKSKMNINKAITVVKTLNNKIIGDFKKNIKERKKIDNRIKLLQVNNKDKKKLEQLNKKIKKEEKEFKILIDKINSDTKILEDKNSVKYKISKNKFMSSNDGRDVSVYTGKIISKKIKYKKCQKPKKDESCPDGFKYRTINPNHKSANFKYCYNYPACAESDKCWTSQNKSGKGKCHYRVAKPFKCQKPKKDESCPDGFKYRTINPNHKSANFKYCYNYPACAESDKCWTSQNKSGKGKCHYRVAKPFKRYKVDKKFKWDLKKPKGCSDYIKGSNGKALKITAYEDAKKLCSQIENCVGVYDWKCDGFGWNLCKSTKEIKHWKYPSCWYKKGKEIITPPKSKPINFTWDKREPKGCSDFIRDSNGKAIKIGSYEAAKKLCSKKENCVGIYDWKCDGSGYNLCKSTDEIIPWKYPSCWYEKSESLFKADSLNKCLTKCKDNKNCNSFNLIKKGNTFKCYFKNKDGKDDLLSNNIYDFVELTNKEILLKIVDNIKKTKKLSDELKIKIDKSRNLYRKLSLKQMSQHQISSNKTFKSKFTNKKPVPLFGKMLNPIKNIFLSKKK